MKVQPYQLVVTLAKPPQTWYHIRAMDLQRNTRYANE